MKGKLYECSECKEYFIISDRAPTHMRGLEGSDLSCPWCDSMAELKPNETTFTAIQVRFSVDIEERS